MYKGKVKIYKSKNGLSEIQVKLENETVGLSPEQIATIFSINRPAITKHINNIFKNGELDKK